MQIKSQNRIIEYQVARDPQGSGASQLSFASRQAHTLQHITDRKYSYSVTEHTAYSSHLASVTMKTSQSAAGNLGICSELTQPVCSPLLNNPSYTRRMALKDGSPLSLTELTARSHLVQDKFFHTRNSPSRDVPENAHTYISFTQRNTHSLVLGKNQLL